MSSHAHSSGQPFKKDLDNLSRQAGVVKDDVVDLAHVAVDAASSGASELRDGARNAVDSAKAKLGEVADNAKEQYVNVKQKAANAANNMQDVVREHPIASIGVALGIGMLIGALISRPRS